MSQMRREYSQLMFPLLLLGLYCNLFIGHQDGPGLAWVAAHSHTLPGLVSCIPGSRKSPDTLSGTKTMNILVFQLDEILHAWTVNVQNNYQQLFSDQRNVLLGQAYIPGKILCTTPTRVKVSSYNGKSFNELFIVSRSEIFEQRYLEDLYFLK